MSRKSSKNKPTVSDIKNQVGCMLKAIAQLDSDEQIEAFGYLQKCFSGLDPEEDTSKTENKGCTELEDCMKLRNKKSNNLRQIEDSNLENLGEHYANVNYDAQVEENTSKEETGFNCIICSKSYSNLETLYEHGLRHTEEFVSCCQCKKAFCSLEIFDAHKDLKMCLKTNSTSNTVLKCSFCDKEFNHGRPYTLHVEGHLRNKCKLCNKNLTTRRELKKHTIKVHNKQLEKDLIQCQFCDRKFAQKKSLLKHYKLTHIEDHIICLTCGIVFSKKEDLNEHVQKHKVVVFKCDLCSVTFSRRQQYDVHVKAHDKYKCVSCEKSYPNKSFLEQHEQDGHLINGLAVQHQCSVCGKGYHFHSSLHIHMKTHARELKPCTPCKQIFKNNATYRQHMASAAAHAPEIVPTEVLQCCCGKTFTLKRKLTLHQIKCKKNSTVVLQCEFCDFKTKVKSLMKQHQSLHTRKKEFICEKCGDCFYTKNALLEHLIYIHSDEKNFSCEKCGQTFKAANVLNRHMVCHSKERNHMCHCGQAYKFKSNLRRHQLMVHRSTTSNRVKRLIDDDAANYSSSHSKKKKKQEQKEKVQNRNVSESIYQAVSPVLMSTQVMATLPSVHSEHHGNILVPSTMAHPEAQMLHVSYHDLNFSTENKSHLVYNQPLDMENLHVVETMLQSDDTLKTESSVLIDSTHQNMFGRQLNDHDATDYHLHSDGLIHPPIEPSLVTSLGEPLHPADADHLSNTSAGQHNLIGSLPDYLPHNFSFLNM